MELTAMESFGVLVMASTVGGVIAIGLFCLFLHGLDMSSDG